MAKGLLPVMALLAFLMLGRAVDGLADFHGRNLLNKNAAAIDAKQTAANLVGDKNSGQVNQNAANQIAQAVGKKAAATNVNSNSQENKYEAGRRLLDTNTGTIKAKQTAANAVGDKYSGQVNQNAANQIAQAVGTKADAANINKNAQENKAGRRLHGDWNAGAIKADQTAANVVGDKNSGQVNQNAANQIAQAVGTKAAAANVNKNAQENKAGRRLHGDWNAGAIKADQTAANVVGNKNSGQVNQNAANQIAQAVGTKAAAANVNKNAQENKAGRRLHGDWNAGAIKADQTAANVVGDKNSGQVNQNAANQIAQAVGTKAAAANVNKNAQENKAGRRLLDTNTGTIKAKQTAANVVGDKNSGQVNQNAANQIAQAVGTKAAAANVNKNAQENKAGRRLQGDTNAAAIKADQTAANVVGNKNSGQVNQNAANQIAQAVGTKAAAANANKNAQKNVAWP